MARTSEESLTMNEQKIIDSLEDNSFFRYGVPSGGVDGANKVFNLPTTPSPTDSLSVWINGQLQAEGVGEDYVLSGSTITFAFAPQTGDKLYYSYIDNPSVL